MKKVALVGGSPSTEGLAPFSDPSFDIWVHGNQIDRHNGRRVTRLFEIHDDLSEHPPEYAGWLANKGIPMIVGANYPVAGEHITRFPFADADALMGGRHLTSTPAYMMALAILEGYEHISIYGVEMAVDEHEYFYQRSSMYAWIAFAKARDIEVYIPPESGLFKDSYVEGAKAGKPQLALDPFSQAEFLKMADQHQDAIDGLSAELRAIEQRITAHSGAKQAYERLAKVARAIEGGATVKTLTESARIR